MVVSLFLMAEGWDHEDLMRIMAGSMKKISGFIAVLQLDVVRCVSLGLVDLAGFSGGLFAVREKA